MLYRVLSFAVVLALAPAAVGAIFSPSELAAWDIHLDCEHQLSLDISTARDVAESPEEYELGVLLATLPKRLFPKTREQVGGISDKQGHGWLLARTPEAAEALLGLLVRHVPLSWMRAEHAPIMKRRARKDFDLWRMLSVFIFRWRKDVETGRPMFFGDEDSTGWALVRPSGPGVDAVAVRLHRWPDGMAFEIAGMKPVVRSFEFARRAPAPLVPTSLPVDWVLGYKKALDLSVPLDSPLRLDNRSSLLELTLPIATYLGAPLAKVVPRQEAKLEIDATLTSEGAVVIDVPDQYVALHVLGTLVLTMSEWDRAEMLKDPAWKNFLKRVLPGSDYYRRVETAWSEDRDQWPVVDQLNAVAISSVKWMRESGTFQIVLTPYVRSQPITEAWVRARFGDGVRTRRP